MNLGICSPKMSSVPSAIVLSLILLAWEQTPLNASEGLIIMAKQLSLEQIVNCGVNQTIAAARLPLINLW